MFPAPSPNSQALFQQLQNGGATPGTLDFHRTAMNAAARSKSNSFPTSNPQEQLAPKNMDSKQQNDPFAHHDATDAANGLFMLAKGGSNNQFTMPNQAVQGQPIQVKPAQTSQDTPKRGGRNNAGSLDSISGPDMSGSPASPDSQEEVLKPNTRGGRGKKTAKAQAAPNGRRKTDDTPKGSNKRAKGNNGVANVDPMLEPHDDDESEDDEDMQNENGKKMTDEEKRRNFLERNRYGTQP